MPWTDTPSDRVCAYPVLWWLRATGSEWQCPKCGKLWKIRPNPDEFIGGREMVPVGNYGPNALRMNMRCTPRNT